MNKEQTHFRVLLDRGSSEFPSSAIHIEAFGCYLLALIDSQKFLAIAVHECPIKEITEDGLLEVTIINPWQVEVLAKSRGCGKWTKPFFLIPYESNLAKVLTCLPSADFQIPANLETQPIKRNGVVAKEFNLYDLYKANCAIGVK